MNPEQDFTRYAFFPIKYPQIKKYYDILKNTAWTAQEINYRDDRDDWDFKMDESTRTYVKFLLFLFAQLDGIVNENLVESFKREMGHIKECAMFFSAQEYNEWTHNETYSLLIQNLIRNEEEQRKGLDSIRHYPEIKKIADWAFTWMNTSRPLMERVVAFACVEGIIFSSAFAGIYHVKRLNVLPGLTLANSWIARDEGVHVEEAVAGYFLFTEILKEHAPLEQSIVHEIIKSAVEVTSNFTRYAMNLEMVGLSADDMITYVKATADTICKSLGFEPIYRVQNKLDWMVVISLPNKSNFFETRATEYSRQSKPEFDFDLEAGY